MIHCIEVGNMTTNYKVATRPDEVLEPMPEEVAIASTLIPYSRDDLRARYLGYLSTGFSVREALHMIDRSKTWLSLSRRDSEFVALEQNIPNIRKELGKEYIELEFFRNFRLTMEKDFQVLKKTLGMEKDEAGAVIPISPYDQAYLLKMRSMYSPQQLSILEAVVSGGAAGFDFSKFVADNPDIIQASRTDTVVMKSKDAT